MNPISNEGYSHDFLKSALQTPNVLNIYNDMPRKPFDLGDIKKSKKEPKKDKKEDKKQQSKNKNDPATETEV